jgi:hypothetical protein
MVRLPCVTVRIGEKRSGGECCSFDHVSDRSKTPWGSAGMAVNGPGPCLIAEAGERLFYQTGSSASRDYCFTSSQLRFAETLPQSRFDFSMAPHILTHGTGPFGR